MWDFFATDVGKVALGGFIATTGSLIVFGLGWLKESQLSSKKQKIEAQHLSIRLVLVLDKLVADCYNAVNDPLCIDEQGYSHSMVPNPDFALPEGGDYRALPTQLMYDIMSMPNRLNAVKEGMDSVGEQSSPPDYEDYYRYRDENLSRLGLRAIGQIESLCNKYKIPPPERPRFYNPKEDLLARLERIEEIDRKRSEAYDSIKPPLPL
ncbi:hypothetical protein RS3R6_10000 [Pseudomonas atacamensis]|uniref:Uncharacterized protein n=1 Tax=Pseudomonas atacamensis TaxID=2565368 RepID=A0ABQ5PLT4_9PSED|nr:hypothetical protein [Pseudomonas atacamensis]GLH44522.1 hypothetical protein RS3R1_36100 [Pseudomonas atacamensis]GLH52819.1 hypothetical protein RS3R6_10000 [Pseudomonas atacamensis]